MTPPTNNLNAPVSNSSVEAPKKASSPLRYLLSKRKSSPSPPRGSKDSKDLLPRTSFESDVTLLSTPIAKGVSTGVEGTGVPADDLPVRNASESLRSQKVRDASSAGGMASGDAGRQSPAFQDGWSVLVQDGAHRDLEVPSYTRAYAHRSLVSVQTEQEGGGIEKKTS